MHRAWQAALAVGMLVAALWALPAHALVPFTGATAIAAGGYHNCAMTGDGAVKCWGTNYYGELDELGAPVVDPPVTTPADVSGLASGVMAIAVGAYHRCALNRSGGVKCWGRDHDNTPRPTPVDVSGLTSGVVAIAEGFLHSCALTDGGGVKCWGSNGNGQLGDGTLESRLTPAYVSGLASGIVAIAAGSAHTCALTNGGAVKCWGDNYSGQLGDGTTTYPLTPVDVSGLAGGVTVIAAGSWYTCALTRSGGVKCWGNNYSGQLGDGTTTTRLTPVDVSALASGVTAIAAGSGHTCAFTSSGGVKCWGYNYKGQLGDGTTTDRLTPVDVSGLSSGIAAIEAGWDHTCALTSGGRVNCWGNNAYGQLGDGTTASASLPVDVLIALAARDFNGDGKSDILWRNSSTGATALWLMDGVNAIGSAFLSFNPSWTVTHVADFNGDGMADLVWRNGATGEIALCLMNGTASIDVAIVSSNANWAVTHVGDFNGDGKADLVWRNSATGQTAIWLMEGLAASASAVILGDPNWIVTHVADVSGDGSADLVWRNNATGHTAIWLMNGLAPSAGAVVLGEANWVVTHTGDFDRDGKADLVWRNNATRQTAIWLMNGLAPRAGAEGYADGSWSVALVADMNGDGRSDLVWEHAALGRTSIRYMSGLVAASGVEVIVDPEWMVTHSANLSGDGNTDLIWRSVDTGQTSVWLLDQRTGSFFQILLNDPNWSVYPAEGR